MAKKKKVYKTNPDTIAINVQQFTGEDVLFPYNTEESLLGPPYKKGHSVLGVDSPKERKKDKGR